jgi:hypothetical protein
MSTIELAAVLAGAVMAIARLARVAAPLWKYGPPWVQALIPLLPLMLTQIGDMLGAVKTTLDLSSVLLFAVLTIAAAVGDARRAASGSALALLLFAGVGLSASGCAFFEKAAKAAPETAARDAYKAAKAACALYELAPAERHTDEMDRTCRSLRLVCE